MGKLRKFIWVLWFTWPAFFVRGEIAPGDVGTAGTAKNIGGHKEGTSNTRPGWKGSKEDALDACTNLRPGGGADAVAPIAPPPPPAPAAGGAW